MIKRRMLGLDTIFPLAVPAVFAAALMAEVRSSSAEEATPFAAMPLTPDRPDPVDSSLLPSGATGTAIAWHRSHSSHASHASHSSHHSRHIDS